LDLATDELRSKLLPASRKLKEIEKERVERRKVRTKTKLAAGPAVPVSAGPSGGPAVPTPASVNTVATTTDVEMADASSIQPAVTSETTVGDTSEAKDEAKDTPGGDAEEDEFTVRQKEIKEFSNLVDASVKTDIGASSTALYELVG